MNEAKVYKVLQGNQGIPKLYWSGVEGNYQVMAVELLGPSLDKIMRKLGKPFSIGTLLVISEQMV